MSSTTKPVEIIARISKGHASEFRVSISHWKTDTKLEFATYTATIPGIFMQAGPSITLPIDKLPKLIDALAAVRKRGLG